MSYKNISEHNQDSFHNLVVQAHNDLNKIHAPYEHPKTKEQYWAIVDEYWPELLNIILMFNSETIEDFKNLDFGKKTAFVVTQLKQDKNRDLVDWFNATWASAPDDGYIHLIPAWYQLCDLCSESYLLYEEQVANP
jgi:hypothetical protein